MPGYSGWQRTNHRVHIDKYTEEGEPIYASLECPPCCPSVANNHLSVLDSYNEKPELWHGHIGSVPLGAYIEWPDGEYRIWECMAHYESTNIGLIDGYRDNPYGDTLDVESAKVLAALPDGSYEVEIEFMAIYGWSDSGPWGPSEYEWEFGWRFVGDPVPLG